MKRWLAGAVVFVTVVAAAGWFLRPLLESEFDVTARLPEEVAAIVEEPPPVSYVSVPVSYSLQKLRELIRTSLSEQNLAKYAKIPKRNITVRVELRDPPSLFMKRDTMILKVPIKFWMRGDLRTKGKMTIYSAVKFGIHEDWSPDINVKSSFEWDWQPRVGIWPFRFRIGDKLAPYIQKALDQGGEKMRQETIKSVHLRDLADSAWRRLQEPQIVSRDQAVWLTMEPQEVYLDPIASDREAIHLNAWLATRIRLDKTAQIAPKEPVPLPNLRKASPPEKTIVVPYRETLTYASLAADLQRGLVGQTIDVGGGSITPTAVRLYTSGADTVVVIRYRGQSPDWWRPARGNVYLSGKPVVDPATAVLRLEGLRFTQPAQGPFFARAATWTVQESLRERVAKAAEWKLEETLAKARADTSTFVNRTLPNNLDVWGSISEFKLVRQAANSEGIGLNYEARGEMSLIPMP